MDGWIIMLKIRGMEIKGGWTVIVLKCHDLRWNDPTWTEVKVADGPLSRFHLEIRLPQPGSKLCLRGQEVINGIWSSKQRAGKKIASHSVPQCETLPPRHGVCVGVYLFCQRPSASIQSFDKLLDVKGMLMSFCSFPFSKKKQSTWNTHEHWVPIFLFPCKADISLLCAPCPQ